MGAQGAHYPGAMDYRAVLTLDYSGMRDSNAYQRVLQALGHAGWGYAETSAMYIESSDLRPILLALELLARAASSPGTLSALTLQVQLIEDRAIPGATKPENAYERLIGMSLPSDSS